ncbi:MAG TPA: pilus assembly protein TadG-related protein [Anaerolineales bacterium]
MKHHRSSNKGQVLIIFVFAIIGLIGITGLAIDGSNIFSDRRHAQNAADTASLAAALVRNHYQKNNPSQPTCANFSTVNAASNPACAAAIINRALDIAAANGYTNNQVSDRVDVYNPPIDGPYSDCSNFTFFCTDYIQVVINTNVNTWFARVVGIGQLHNQVEAVALSKYSPHSLLYGGNSLVELRPTSGPGCGTITGGQGGGDVYLGGSSGLVLNGGGIFVNSNNPDCSLKITNTCPSIQLLNGAIVQGMGGQFAGCNPPILQHATQGYPYPPDGSPVSPIPPAVCSLPVNTSNGVPNADGTFHFLPGHYFSLPPDKNTTLEHGVYCVDNLIKTTNSFTFIADGVFMYVKPGGQFNFQGGTIQLAAPGLALDGKPIAQVSSDTKPYQGYLIYVDETNWTGSPGSCNVNAGSDTQLKGVIYAPHCNVTINGGSGTVGITAQVIAYTLNLTGNALLNFTYDGTKMPGVPEKMLMSLTR